MKKLLFVYNPVSGTGLVKKKMFDIVQYYSEHDILVTLCPIRKLFEFGDSIGLDDYDNIVVSGGDGTLNNFLAYISEHGCNQAIGYIPAGSTNDYALSLGIPKNLEDAFNSTINGIEQAIDVGIFNDNRFLYVAAFGIFTSVVYTTPQEIKNVLGHSAYILEGIKQLSELQSYKLSLTIDDELVEGSFILGLVTNTFSVGGVKNTFHSNVALDDGVFEVMFIKEPENIIELNGIILALTSDNPGANKNIIIRKAKHVKVIHDEATEWTLDGEYGGAVKEADISIENKKFRIVV